MDVDFLIWADYLGIVAQQRSRSSEGFISSADWLKPAYRTVGATLLKPQDLEILRRNACNREAITEVFENRALSSVLEIRCCY